MSSLKLLFLKLADYGSRLSYAFKTVSTIFELRPNLIAIYMKQSKYRMFCTTSYYIDDRKSDSQKIWLTLFLGGKYFNAKHLFYR